MSHTATPAKAAVTLYTGFHQLVTGDVAGTVLNGVDILVRDGEIIGLGPDLPRTLAPIGVGQEQGVEVVNCRGLTAYPGLINTHHHFFQAFVRNLAPLDWTQLDVLAWLRKIYPVFALVDEDCIYHSTVVSMAELIKHGCTTAFDHQYNYSRRGGPFLVDRQFDAAHLLGLRFHAGRGCITLPMAEGSTIPDAMRESTDTFLADCERLVSRFHDPRPFAMQRVVVAPSSPVIAYPETFVESARLARHLGVSLHTHLGEGETPAMVARFGERSLDWCENRGFVGPDVWLAHGWEFTAADIARLAATGTGVAHCPAPVFLVGAEVTDIPAMAAAGVRVGFGVDGHASNDSSNLAECIRLAYLLQCLKASERQHPVPAPYDFLRMATQGGADCLNRPDLGALAVGRAADFFAVDLNRIEYIGANHDPRSLPAKVGFSGPVDMTVINGKVVWRNGEFPGLDEMELARAADGVFRRVIYGDPLVAALRRGTGVTPC